MKKTTKIMAIALLLGSIVVGSFGCKKPNGSDCDSNDDCMSGCCYDAEYTDPWCTSDGDNCMDD